MVSNRHILRDVSLMIMFMVMAYAAAADKAKSSTQQRLRINTDKYPVQAFKHHPGFPAKEATTASALPEQQTQAKESALEKTVADLLAKNASLVADNQKMHLALKAWHHWGASMKATCDQLYEQNAGLYFACENLRLRLEGVEPIPFDAAKAAQNKAEDPDACWEQLASDMERDLKIWSNES